MDFSHYQNNVLNQANARAVHFAIEALHVSARPREVQYDYFDEGEGWGPTEEERAITLKMVEAMERDAGRKLDELTEQERQAYLNDLYDLSDSLLPVPTDAMRAKALATLEEMRRTSDIRPREPQMMAA